LEQKTKELTEKAFNAVKEADKLALTEVLNNAKPDVKLAMLVDERGYTLLHECCL
jgi:hypothetical protein